MPENAPDQKNLKGSCPCGPLLFRFLPLSRQKPETVEAKQLDKALFQIYYTY